MHVNKTAGNFKTGRSYPSLDTFFVYTKNTRDERGINNFRAHKNTARLRQLVLRSSKSEVEDYAGHGRMSG